jgi:hypothetical protein
MENKRQREKMRMAKKRRTGSEKERCGRYVVRQPASQPASQATPAAVSETTGAGPDRAGLTRTDPEGGHIVAIAFRRSGVSNSRITPVYRRDAIPHRVPANEQRTPGAELC